jgi:hypothetical protein
MRLRLVLALSLVAACSDDSEPVDAAAPPADAAIADVAPVIDVPVIDSAVPPDSFYTADAGPGWEVDVERIYADVAELSSDAYGGRLAGTTGNEDALSYVEDIFTDLGLTPAGTGGTYRQAFTFASWKTSAPASFTLAGASLVEGEDYAVLEYAGTAEVSGDLVFAGYGITVPAFDPADYPSCPLAAGGYDDYADLDVSGKIVVVLRHGPADDAAVNTGCPVNTDGQAWLFGYKAANARLHGAAAIILVQHYASSTGEHLAGTIGEEYYDSGFPVISVDRDLIEAQVPELSGWADAIDAESAPGGHGTAVATSLVTSGAMMEVTTDNVLGALPGTSPGIADEVIVIGAHIDHVGSDPSMCPGVSGTTFCHGADDNASGSAVMLELARVMVHAGFTPARTIVFAAFNAEEEGLWGSCYYVDHPTYPIANTKAMYSVDMVGAGDGSGLILYGGQTTVNSWLVDLMEGADSAAGLTYAVTPEAPLDASDHACFGYVGVPAVLALSLGPHTDYHTPADTIDTIVKADLLTSAQMLWASLRVLSRGDEAGFLGKPAHKPSTSTRFRPSLRATF